MNVVITMAGMGSRFRKAGYTVPKYMIDAQGKTLFEWSMISLKGFMDITSKFIFIVRKEDDSADFIKNSCKNLSISDYEIIEIDYLTDGQASTALLARRHWNPTDSLLVYNIDTYVEEGAMNSAELKGDGFIPCFKGEGDHWSFVRLNADGLATEVREKRRISEYCTLGAYYFKSCELYESLYQEYYQNDSNKENNEKYIAPLYNLLIDKGGQVYISNVLIEAVHVLGTPEELTGFLEQFEVNK